MVHRTVVLLALALLPGTLWAQSASSVNDLEETLGSCAAQPGQDTCAFTLSVLAQTDGTPVYLIAGKAEGQGNPPHYKETDRVSLPVLAPDYFLSTSCKTPGQPYDDTTLIAAVRFPDGSTETSSDVSYAWRLDTKTGKLNQEPRSKVSCSYEGP